MIVIVDYGLGNLSSIQNMIKKIGYDSHISSEQSEIAQAGKIILPGVGGFDEGIRTIDAYGLRYVLNQKAKVEKIPFLGICLGMQLMTNESEEGTLKGLSIVNGKTKRFPSIVGGKELRIPHIGWNYVKASPSSKLTEGIDENSRFYFVHSYYVELNDIEQSVMWTNYGIDFAAGYASENILGVQFHPEKSHRYGRKLLENFLKNY